MKILKKKQNVAKKNAFRLVLPNEEISLRLELSSSPRFRIQGGTVSITNKRTNGNPCVQYWISCYIPIIL